MGAFVTGKAFRTPGQPFGGSAVDYVMQSEEEACVISYSSTVGVAIWRIVAGTAAQAIDGDITVAAGNGGTRTAAITAGVIVNADINASAAIALSKLATQAADTFVGNFTSSLAVPTARAGSSVAGGGLTYTTGGTMAVGAGTGITVNANDVAVTIPLTDGDKGDITVSSSGTVFTVDAATITPAKLAVVAANVGATFAIRVTFAAGTPGSADDVTIYSGDAPFAFRILDVTLLTSTLIALSTAQLRDTAGGGGAALSSAMTTAVVGTARNNDTATPTVAANGSVFLRRSDQGVAGEVIILAVKT